jgi:transketolase
MPEMIATRDAYGKVLAELGAEHPEIVVLDGDLWNSTKTEEFRKRFPERFFDMGIAEQNMFAAAAGLALSGKIPFVSTFACFGHRAWEHVRVSISIQNTNVKMVTTHAGITTGEDGHTAQMMEDLAAMRVLPNITVIAPADAVETEKAVRAIATHKGPVWMRLGRAKVPVLFDDNYQFRIGKATLMRDGKDVTIVACGIMLAEALKAADSLAPEGIEAAVINMSTIKPLDVEALVNSARKTGCVVTAEEHQITGGLGGAVAEALGEHCPVPLERVGMRDCYGESGHPDELLAKYGFTSAAISQAAKKAVSRKA